MRRKVYITVSILMGLIVVSLLSWNWYQDRVELNEIAKENSTRVGIEEYQDSLETKHPLVGYLPYETADFEVHYGLESEENMEVLYLVVVNMGNVFEGDIAFNELYLSNLQKARVWIANQGFNMDDLNPEIVVEHD